MPAPETALAPYAPQPFTVSYFPGCSLATSARESNHSLIQACRYLGLTLEEVPDWNCCGSSSAHALDADLSLSLAARNLARTPKNRPLLIMCPSCHRNLLSAHLTLADDPDRRQAEERRWGAPIDPGLNILSFMEVLHFLERLKQMGLGPAPKLPVSFGGLKAAPYYGCMNQFPLRLKRVQMPRGRMGASLNAMGAEKIYFPERDRCCGTFLTAARTDVSTPLVNGIMQSAIDAGAECLVTACAMCQLNLELRCNLKHRLPILHFSEVLALSMGSQDHESWFKRHLIDPRPLLAAKGVIKKPRKRRGS